MSKRIGPKTICMISVLCAATVVASPAQTFTTLVNFDGTNGANPDSPLIQGTDGNLYGTTSEGGTTGSGTVFKVTPQGTLTRLYSFCSGIGSESPAKCPDGISPYAGLTQGTDGNFYGTTYAGGFQQVKGSVTAFKISGTAFKITPDGTLTTLYSFCTQYEPGFVCPDGAFPYGGLIQATDGNFYGTTSEGGKLGPSDHGTVFKIIPCTPTSDTPLCPLLSTLHSFSGSGIPPDVPADGTSPSPTALVQATDGNFYGTTGYDGPTGSRGELPSGTVFKITPEGTLTTLHAFYGTDGAHPYGALVQATDGNFYGTTTAGGTSAACGSDGCGTVFKITPGGVLTTLHSFDFVDGASPYGTLAQATDGNFYGTTRDGGAYYNYGTIFRITPEGKLTTLHSFNGTDGRAPYGGLVEAADGKFYGTTSHGGANDLGTVFSLSVTGPAVTFDPATMWTGQQVVGTTGAVHALTLTNIGTTPLSITSIATTGGFDQTNNCGASLAAGTSCTIEVTFTPSTAGEITGTLSVTDNAFGSPHRVSLSGRGQDFAVGFSRTTETVTAGQTASYDLQITPLGGFNQTVALICSGAPPSANCVVSPASIAPPSGEPVSVSVKVSTQAPSMTLGSITPGRRLPPFGPLGSPWLWLGALTAVIMALAARRRRLLLASTLVLFSVMTWIACGGGAAPSTSTPGTPNGTFTIMVNATSGPLAHTATTTLVVH